MNHTPAPWNIGSPLDPTDSCSDTTIVTENGRIVCQIWLDDKEDKANGNLITASPGLLEALEAVIDWAIEKEAGSPYKAGIMKGPAFEKARLAMDKAKGKK